MSRDNHIAKIIRSYIDKQNLFNLRSKLLVAVSGGVDSVVLLRMLVEMGYNCGVAHCNFHLRGEESDRDELFVNHLCLSLKVTLHLTHFDTMEYAERENISIEMAARQLRYDYFEQLSNAFGYTHIVVGHHIDDSVETILLNLIRGTGIRGVSGIKPRNGKVVRPLLAVTREEIVDYAGRHNFDYVFDSTNNDSDYTRNKIRNEVIPLLHSINPSFSQSLLQSSNQIAEAMGFYDKALSSLIESITEERAGERLVSINRLLSSGQPELILYEILKEFSFNRTVVNEVLDAMGGEAGRQFFSSTHRVIKDREWLIVQLKEEKSAIEVLTIDINSGALNINIPFYWEIVNVSELTSYGNGKESACFDAEKVGDCFIIRGWKHGDFFYPFGGKGKRKLSDLYRDLKYSLSDKERALVMEANNHIAWVVGERTDKRFAVTPETKRVLVINYKR